MVQPNLLTETFPKTDPEIVKLGAEVRDLLSKAIRRSGKNAAEVAQEMTKRLGRPITESMVYELTRNSDRDQPREVRLLATWVPAFCEVTGDDRLQRWLAGPRLRELVELGERVSSMGWVLRQMQDELARLTGRGLQKKAKGKGTRKA
jgi:hypothetical protein